MGFLEYQRRSKGKSMHLQTNRILLVEDDEGIQELLSEFLRDEGFSCDVASNGQIATEKLLMNSYDLLITDFRMPKMNGVELITWCRTNRYHFPVIFITATASLMPEEDIAVNDYCAILIHKPLPLQLLLNTIKYSLQGEQIFENLA
jgi:DNA-binding response OmpR family regulator